MEPLRMIEDRPGRELAFEPLLDQLAEVFQPDRAPWGDRPDGTPPDWYERCETKRLAVARAAAEDLDLVREHADLVVRAIVHDTCRSGNRQLIQVALRALGTRAVLETLIEYVESGNSAEQTGASMAMYWAHPAVAYEPREARAHQAEIAAIENSLVELRSQARQACLRAFLATEDPAQRADLSLRFTLDPADYPAHQSADVARALEIALADDEHFDTLLRTLPPEQTERT